MRRAIALYGGPGVWLAAVSAIATAQSASTEFSADAIRAHLEFLADDHLEGRGTGTRGYDLAALYVAAQFRAAGLAPAVDGGWFQPVPMVERMPGAGGAGVLTIGSESYPLGDATLAVISGEGWQEWRGKAVFLGLGLPTSGDVARLDLAGKALVLIEDPPGGLSPELAWEWAEQRRSLAAAGGAAGFIYLPLAADSDAAWSDLRSEYAWPFHNWLRADGEPYRTMPMRFTVRPRSPSPTIEGMFAGSDYSWADLRERAQRGEPLPAFELAQEITISSHNSWRRFTSPNVIGMVRGSDPAVAGECLLVTSHLDHVGIDPKEPGEDKIFNGALDNASGIAAMIEVARGMATAAPRRSVLFVATTGEEIGLLGSDYLAANPLPVCDRVAGVVNLDGGVPPHELPAAVASGGWHSTIGKTFEAVAAENGIVSLPDEPPPAPFFDRTDSYSFARRGVPSIYLVMSAGEGAGPEAYVRDRVHRPNDDLTIPFNWSAGARFARLAHDLVRRLADAPEAPRWYDDSPFAQRVAKDRPKAPRSGE
jgi:hypothetical protein